MADDIDSYLQKGNTYMNDAIEHLHNELIKIRTGKASPAMLGGIMVDYYGAPTPLNQAANITTPDSRSLAIQPWDKSLIQAIEKGIFEANLGLTPQSDGEMIRLNIPPLTEERRVDLVKQAKALGEEAKVSLRNARHKMMDFIKTEVKAGFPEDAGKRKEGEVESMIKSFSDKIDQTIDAKEKDIMTV